jgi:hypothetical protein
MEPRPPAVPCNAQTKASEVRIGSDATAPDAPAPWPTKWTAESSCSDPYFTWHHHQDVGRMQLVPRTIHRDTGHIGGFEMWYGRQNGDR